MDDSSDEIVVTQSKDSTIKKSIDEFGDEELPENIFSKNESL
jgi:hypothetical protein